MNWHDFLAVIAFIFVIGVLIDGVQYDSTDDAENGRRSGMQLYVDYETGCEYLSGSNLFGSAGITPRLNPEGRQICRNHYE